MNKKDTIATYYANAKLLLRENKPKAARDYVLQILNEGLEIYQKTADILLKAKTKAFLEKWVYVSKDLYAYGITDYVLECFGLDKQSLSKPKAAKEKTPPKPKESPAQSGGIDMAGLIEDAEKTQGWCSDVFEANKNAVVEISGTTATGVSSGTGFIISDKGYLLTNDHVAYDEKNCAYFSNLTFSLSGENKKHKLEVLFSDKKSDVALCKFNPAEVQGFKSVRRVVDYSLVKQGADCLVIGNAFGMGLAPFTGIVRFTKSDAGNLVYTAPSNPGDSGGPVFNRFGECIGINKSKTVSVNRTAAEGYANATPMDKIDELLKKWTDKNGIEL